MIVFGILLGASLTGLLVVFDFWHCRARNTHPATVVPD